MSDDPRIAKEMTQRHISYPTTFQDGFFVGFTVGIFTVGIFAAALLVTVVLFT